MRTTLLLSGCCLLTVSAAGCKTLWRSPIAENVVEARQLSMQGLDLMQQGRWDDAERAFANAIKACPSDERAHRSHAEVMWQKGQRDPAIKEMIEAARLSGGDAETIVRLGEMYLAVGNLSQANNWAVQAVAANRQLARAWALQGEVLYRQGNDDGALAAFHRALGIQEQYDEAQLAVARIYHRQGRAQRTLATLQPLLARLPTQQTPAEVHLLCGLAYKALGRYDDAVESLAIATRGQEPPADLLFHLAEAQYLLGDLGGAQTTASRGTDRFPQHQALRQLRTQMDQPRF